MKRGTLALALLAASLTVAIIAGMKLVEIVHTRAASQERVDPHHSGEITEIEREHIARYEFAGQYCKNKAVADIASGTGYGAKILARSATSVDGYDREPLGQRYVIDLEKEAWTRRYDVIVSFETIEHLANPDFFLTNVARTSQLFIMSTPLDETLGWSTPYHKQAWTEDGIKALLGRFFRCEYLFQKGEQFDNERRGEHRCIIAICRPKA